MKIRQGFVSNSSSSSFVLDKTGLDSGIEFYILNHIWIARRVHELDGNPDYGRFGYSEEGQEWYVEIDGQFVRGETSMDNFNMEEFIHKFLGVPESAVEWSYEG